MNRRATRTLVERTGGADRRGDDPSQPNDRDESSRDAAPLESLAPVQREQMERAHRDAEGPTVDTDCHGVRAGPDGCRQPSDPTMLDDVLVPGGRDAENTRTASHDPGPTSTGPDGTTRD